MADINISELPPILSATDDDVIIINDADTTTSKITWANLKLSIDSFAGQVSFTQGTESNPSITFTGDLNLGLYSPASDQIAIVTNGTSRLYIDEAGRVAIGNTNPQDYSTISNNLVVGSETSGDNGITVLTGSSDLGIISFADGTDATSETAGRIVYSHIDDHLHFETNSEEVLRVTSNGNVGIGTTQPDSLLHVSSGDSGVSNTVPGVFGPIVEALSTQNAGMVFRTASNRTGGFYFSDPANAQAGSVVFDNSTDNMAFSIASTERLGISDDAVTFSDSSSSQIAKITNEGRLRIGTGNPTSAPLSLTSDITGSIDAQAIDIDVTVQGDVTSSFTTYSGAITTAASSFTLPNAYQFKSQGGTIGTGSSITNQYGFHVSNLGNATNNYGFYSDLSTAGDFQFYSAGTSPNYFNGSVHTFVNGGSGVALTISGGAITSPSGTINTLNNTTLNGNNASFTQVNTTDLDFTSSIEGPSATITTIGATSVNAGLFTGNLTGDVTGDLTGNADTATQVTVSDSNTNAARYLSFVSGTGNQDLKYDTDLSYNPSTNILSVPRIDGTTLNYSILNATTINTTDLIMSGSLSSDSISSDTVTSSVQLNSADIDFTGSIEGPTATITTVNATNVNATTVTATLNGDVTGNADSASQVFVTQTDTTNTNYFPSFTSSGGSNRDIRVDSSYTYNPSTNTLTAGKFSSGQGVISVITSDNVTTTDLTVSGTLTVPGDIVGNISGDSMTVNDLTINDDLIVTDTATFNGVVNFNSTVNGTFTGSLVGNADSSSSVSTANNTGAGNQYVLFVGNATGNQSLRTNGSIRYQPSTNTLSTNLSGNVTGNVTGNSDTATTSTNANNINVIDETSDTTCFPVFTNGATGNMSPKTDGTNLKYNSVTGLLTSTGFSGDGSALTSLNASNITSGTISDDRLPNSITSDITGNAATATTSTNSTNSTNVNVALNNTTSTQYLVFTPGSGNQRMNIDTSGGPTYDPDTDTLTVANISAQIDGVAENAINATNSTNSVNVDILTDNSTNAEHYLLFSNSQSGNQRIQSDNGITYNPSTDTITVSNITGNSSSSSSVNVDNSTGATNYRILFSSGTTSNETVLSNTGVLVNPSTGAITSNEFIGDLTGNADTATVATNVTIGTLDTGDTTVYPVFTLDSSAGDKPLYEDSALAYNTTSNILTAGTFSGSHSGDGSALTSLNASNISSGTISDARLPSTISSDITGNAATADDATNSTNATNINVATDSSGTGSKFLLFTDDGSGNTRPKSDTALRYVPSTDTLTVGNISGNGASLTSLNASNISSGTISDDRLPASISSDITGNAATATTAGLLDNLDSTQFLRSDSADVKTSGDLTFNDNVNLNFGTGNDAELFCNGTEFYLDLNSGINNFIIRDGTVTRFTFDDDGHFTATGDINSSSDLRLKENLEVISNPINKVKELTGYTYDRIDIDSHQAGVIAQEVEKVLPVAVTDGEDGFKSVAYNQLIPLLIEAIKDQQKQIDGLKELLN